MVQSPFGALTFVAAPALLTNASSVLALSTINRMLRTRDRMHELFAKSEAGKASEQESGSSDRTSGPCRKPGSPAFARVALYLCCAGCICLRNLGHTAGRRCGFFSRSPLAPRPCRTGRRSGTCRGGRSRVWLCKSLPRHATLAPQHPRRGQQPFVSARPNERRRRVQAEAAPTGVDFLAHSTRRLRAFQVFLPVMSDELTRNVQRAISFCAPRRGTRLEITREEFGQGPRIDGSLEPGPRALVANAVIKIALSVKLDEIRI